MRKMMLLMGMLVAMMIAAPAIAGEFYAMDGIKGATPLQDQTLAATEGGSTCDAGGLTAKDQGAGVCLVSLISHPSGATIAFSVTNALPVTAANYLQVTGF